MTDEIRIEKHLSTCEAFQETYGISPSGIYCLVTGKRIGTTDDSELMAIFDSLRDDDDAEGRADDLAMRLFASMRPSMRWNKMRMESLEELRKAAPHETMSYLLNRLFAMLDRRQSYVMEHLQRIRIYQHVTTLAADADRFESLMFMLLEVDAKLGLQNLAAPFTAQSVLACQSFESIITLVSPWHKKMVHKWEQDQAEGRFMQANPLAKQSFLNTYMAQKPVSNTSLVRDKKVKESQFFNDIYDSIVGAEEPVPVKPAPVAIKMPKRFGGLKS